METINFYTNLLNKVLLEIKENGYNTIVFGPLKTQTEEFTRNLEKFQEVFLIAESKNHKVFNQIPYLDIHLEGAPFDFDQKFPIFFGGIIASGLITDAFFVPGWELSRGSQFEHELCVKHGITIHYI